jgi:hypothetical protein
MTDERIAFISASSFSYRDIQGQDKWSAWTPVYSFTTATALTVTGRFKVVGRQCFFQVKSTGTSLATTAGTDYIALPLTAVGFGGMGVMSNDTANTAVGVGHIDVTNSRFYPPSQGASGNDFIFAGWFEV